MPKERKFTREDKSPGKTLEFEMMNTCSESGGAVSEVSQAKAVLNRIAHAPNSN